MVVHLCLGLVSDSNLIRNDSSSGGFASSSDGQFSSTETLEERFEPHHQAY